MKQLYIFLLLAAATVLFPTVGEAQIGMPRNVRVAHKSDNHIILTWDSPNNSNSYSLLYEYQILTPYMPGIRYLYSRNVTLKQLLPDTAYRIQIRTISTSPARDTSAWFDTVIWTEPTRPITQLPYHYGFEPDGIPYPSYPPFDLANGWYVYGNYSTSMTPYNLMNYTNVEQDPEEPDNYFLMLSQNTFTNAYKMLTLPPIDTTLYSLDTLRMKFTVWNTANIATKVLVGMVDNPRDSAGFELIDSITLGVTTSRREATIPLGGIRNRRGRIALITSRIIYLDNFVIERVPTLPTPQQLTVGQIGPASATLQWLSPGRTVQGYSITLQPSDSLLPTRAMYSQNTSVVVSQLEPMTTYTATVRAVYGSESFSDPATAIFRTVSLPCLIPDSTTDTFILTGVDTYGYNQLPFRTSGSPASQTRQIILQREIDNLGAVTGIDFYYLDSIPLTGFDSCTIFLSNTRNNKLLETDASVRRVVYSGPMNCTQGWNHFEFDTPFEYDGGNLVVDVASPLTAPPSSGARITTRSFRAHVAPYCSSDNFFFTSSHSVRHLRNDMRLHYRHCQEADSCIKVSLTVTHDTVGLSRIEWGQGLGGSQWDVYLRSAEDSVAVLVDSAHTANWYDFTNLQSGGSYQIVVVPYCNNMADTARADTLTHLAPCITVDTLPHLIDFDMPSNGGDCYHLLGGAKLVNRPTYFGGVGSYSIHPDGREYSDSVHHSVQLSTIGTDMIVLPKTNENVRSLTLSFVHTTRISSGLNKLSIGVIPNGDTAFIPVNVVRPSEYCWGLSVVDFSSYEGRNGRIAIRVLNGDSIYIDSIVIDRVPYCSRPSNVRIRNITATSAVVQWDSVPNAFSYEIEYYTSDFSSGSVMSAASYGNSVTLNGLKPSSLYEIRIRSHCLGGDTSAWTFPGGFSTSCTALTSLPYEMAASVLSATGYTGIYPPCWDSRLSRICVRNIIDSSGHQRGGIMFQSDRHEALFLPSIDTAVVSFSNISLRFRAHALGQMPQLAIGEGTLWPSRVNSIDTIAIGSSPQWYEVCFGNPASGPAYHPTGMEIFFAGLNDSSLFFIDSVGVYQQPACRTPRNIYPSEVSDTSVVLQWTDLNSAYDQYDLDIEDTSGSVLHYTGVSSPFAVTGLATGATYTGRIRAACLNGDSSYSHTFQFSTLDSVVNVPYCTHLNEPGDSGFAVRHRYIEFGQRDTTYKLTVRVRTIADTAYDGFHIYIGRPLHPRDSLIATPHVTSEWQTFTYEIPAYHNIRQLLFQCDSYAGFAATVEVADVCIAFPDCPEPTSIAVVPTDSSAFVRWEGSPYATYQVVIAPTGLPGQSDTLYASTNSLNLGGLLAATYYTLSVRRICDTDNFSPFHSTQFITHTCADAQTVNLANLNTSGVSFRLPVHTAYPYSYTQQIYTAAEVGRSGLIRTLSFHYDSSSAPLYKSDCRIYMGHTRLAQFTSLSEMVDDDFDLVYYGDLPAQPGWNALTLQSPYYYTGTDNLLLVVVDHSNAQANGAYYSVNETGRAASLCVYGSSPFDPRAATSQGVTMSYHNSIRLEFCSQESCIQPHLRAPILHPYHVTFRWENDSTATGYTLQYRSAESEGEWNTFTTTDTVLRVDAALPTGDYLVRLARECPFGTSSWSYRVFSIPVWQCPPVDEFHISDISGRSVSLAWSPAPANNSFYVRVFNNAYDSIYSTDSTSFTIRNLEVNVPYSIAVRADCPDSNAFSIWSDTLHLTIPICPPVSEGWVTDVHGSRATLDWDGPEEAWGWIIAYGYLGTTLEYAIRDTVHVRPYTLHGLTPEEDYVFFIRTLCDSNYTSERWSDPGYFSTTVGIHQYTDDNTQVSIFPNPANGDIRVSIHDSEGTNSGTLSISLLDLVGRQIADFTSQESSFTIPETLFPIPGTYLLRISSEDSSSVYRIVKQ